MCHPQEELDPSLQSNCLPNCRRQGSPLDGLTFKSRKQANNFLLRSLTIIKSFPTPLTNGNTGCSGTVWQHITTVNIASPLRSRRIIAGLCTWQCHVNTIHERERKKSVKCLFCRGTTRRLLIFKSLGMCNTHVMDFLVFSTQFRQAFAYSWGTPDPMMGDSQR